MLGNFFIHLSEVPFMRAGSSSCNCKKEYCAARQIVEDFAFKYHRTAGVYVIM